MPIYPELHKFEKEGTGDSFAIIYWIKIDPCISNSLYTTAVGVYVLFFAETLSCYYNPIINKTQLLSSPFFMFHLSYCSITL